MHPVVRALLFSFVAILLILNPLQAAAKSQGYFSGTSTRNGVSVSVKELSPQEAKRRLGNKFSLRNRHSIIPLSVSVTNDTDHLVEFSKKDISLELVSSEYLRRFMDSGLAAGSVFLGSILALFIGVSLPFLFMMAVVVVGGVPSFIVYSVLSLGVVSALFIGGGLWAGSKQSASAYWKVLSPYKEGYQYVASGETDETVIYVRKRDLKKSFNVAVNDVPNNQTMSVHIEGAYVKA